jgi:septum site-determining protein MinD
MGVKKIIITSCKGGVGKSTIAANLGLRLAQNGHKTLLVDCDFGIRSLDLILGAEDRVVFDIRDVAIRGVEFSRAVISDNRSPLLDFCAAPAGECQAIEPSLFRATINRVAEEHGYEYILLDTPGDEGDTFTMAASAAESALIISTMLPTSIRAAEKTGVAVAEAGITNQRLIINCFDFTTKPPPGQASVLEIVDKTYLQLIGIIPYDSRLPELQLKGGLIDELPGTNTAAAFANIAQRLTGRNIPLFTSFRGINRKNLMKHILSTRPV